MSASRRDPALDVIRGLCIVSMVIGHLSDGSLLDEYTHRVIWVDGATGFVLLAGLVLGMVQRRQSQLRGVQQLARRARLVWASHVALVLLAVLVAPWRQMQPAATASGDELGGPLSTLWQAATLRLNPIEVDILSLYVVLFAVAALAVTLVRLRQVWLVAVLSVSVYVAGMSNPSWASLPRTADGPFGSHFNIASWQLMFVAALLLGWYWHTDSTQRLLADRRLFHGALAVTLAGVVLYQAVNQFGLISGAPAAALRSFFGKSTLGIGQILLGFAVLLVLYRVLRSARTATVTAPLAALAEPLGRRSLAAYIILSGFDLLLGSFAPYEQSGLEGMQWAVVVIVVAWWWARLRDRYPVRLPAVRLSPRRAPVPAPDGIAAQAGGQVAAHR